MNSSTLSFDQLFEALLGASAVGVVFAALWIVCILIQIEANKQVFYSVDLDNNLELKVEDGMEVEKEGGSPPSSPKGGNTMDMKKSTTRNRRVRGSFKAIQVISVSVLILLTYLLLVMSNAPKALSGLGSICVFCVFLRFQIGDELRRQRVDRLILLMSLFLLIASFLSLGTYSMKSLKQGEMYEGPARIIGYDSESYNNTEHDPSTRMDVEVSFGMSWGCPLTGGKVCQSDVKGAMCQVTDTRRRRALQQQKKRHFLASRQLEEDEGDETNDEELESEEMTNEELEKENQDLADKNAELEKEVEEMETEEEFVEDEAEEEVEEAEDEATEEENEAYAEVEEAYAEEEKDAGIYDEAIIEEDEEIIDVEEEYATDDAVKEEYEDEKVELDEYDTEIQDELDGAVDEYEEYADEYDAAAESAEEAMEAVEVEEESTEDAYIEEIEKEEGESDEEIEEEEEEEIEEEEEEEWYWDEVSYAYDDDLYEEEYWGYDWDSAWGDYACEDLFDADISGRKYDLTTPPGNDDYPFIQVYASCKTCDAYILDYFAEEAFEKYDDYRKQAILYFTGALAGFVISLISFTKYKLAPPPENEIELLGSESGVVA